MQTAVDRNGSSKSTTTTTVTSTAIEEDKDPIGTVTQPQQMKQSEHQHDHHPPHQSHFPKQIIPQTETTNTLRHRVTTNNDTNCSTISDTKNGFSHLIDADEYVGSNVGRMSVTPSPSPSPTASPSKRNKLKEDLIKLAASGSTGLHTIAFSAPLQDTYKQNTSSDSSSSKTVSNSTSTTSSVIATPVLKRHSNSLKDKEEEEPVKDDHPKEEKKDTLKQVLKQKDAVDEIGFNADIKPQSNKNEQKPLVTIDAVSDDCKQFRECNYKQLSTNQRLPQENTSSTTIIEKDLSSSSLLISSSTTSLSIKTLAVTANANKSRASSTATTPSPSSSSLISSASASETSVTSLASNTATPALLSTSTATSVSSSSLPQTPSSSESKLKGFSISGVVQAELLQWHDMPQYLQFNPYVLKGYRPLTTFKGCLLSMFYWHNETINILTHALPIVYILATVPGLMPWENGYRFLSFCHVFGSVAPWCGSFVYHLFMNIEQGENVYYKLLKLDMVGIWVSQSFGAFPLLTATTFCFSFKWKLFILMSYSIFSLWGLYKALTANSPWQRRLCFALPFTLRSILTFFRAIGLVGGNRVAMEHVYLQDGVSILGGAIGAMRIPEKWFPGFMDFYLNSHNIMHVLVVVAVYSMHKATMKDLEWMDSVNCDAFANITSKVLESTLNTKIEL